MSDDKCISEKEIIERLTRIETILDVTRAEHDKAIIVAKEIVDTRLEALNHIREAYARDRDQFVRKESYDIKMNFYDITVKDIYKYIYIAVGIVTASQFFLYFMLRGITK